MRAWSNEVLLEDDLILVTRPDLLRFILCDSATFKVQGGCRPMFGVLVSVATIEAVCDNICQAIHLMEMNRQKGEMKEEVKGEMKEEVKGEMKNMGQAEMK